MIYPPIKKINISEQAGFFRPYAVKFVPLSYHKNNYTQEASSSLIPLRYESASSCLQRLSFMNLILQKMPENTSGFTGLPAWFTLFLVIAAIVHVKLPEGPRPA
jgi:hypothetical protein